MVHRITLHLTKSVAIAAIDERTDTEHICTAQFWRRGQTIGWHHVVTVGRITAVPFEQFEHAHVFTVATANDVLVYGQMYRHKIQIDFERQFNEIDVLEVRVVFDALDEFVQFDASMDGTDQRSRLLTRRNLMRIVIDRMRRVAGTARCCCALKVVAIIVIVCLRIVTHNFQYRNFDDLQAAGVRRWRCYFASDAGTYRHIRTALRRWCSFRIVWTKRF